MAENENVVVEELPVEPQPEQKGPSKGQQAKAKVKEWFRKKIVGLKRKPQNIALLFLLVSAVFFMLTLFPLSQALSTCNAAVKASGICQFIVTLLSLLALVSFLNAFPKRKKANIFFIVLVFVMIAGMIACDIVIYTETLDYITNGIVTEKDIAAITPAHPLLIAHVVLLGVSAIVFALLPAYRILINKINTKVELESATENMHGEIDIQED